MKRNKSILVSTLVAGAMVIQGESANAQSALAVYSTDVRRYHVHIPEKSLSNLKRRLKETRLPDKETVTDQTQGVQLSTIQNLLGYWTKGYDWRKAEEKLNAFPQFTTTIDGVDIHFIHVRSKEANALPVIITHGWPGSVFEELKLIGPLTNPVAYGGKAEDAFDVVIPSLPGYGFSGKPTTTGWNTDRIARAWDTLMKRLGYSEYVSQGGDWGARVSEAMAHLAPKGLRGVHMNLLLTLPPEINLAIATGAPSPNGLSEQEQLAYKQRKALGVIGYYVIQGRRPQTIGFAIADSPAGLAAWLLDHDAHTYEQMRQLSEGKSVGALTRDDILDNITLYWLTNTGTSAARLYWENARLAYNGNTSVPAAFTVFPGEVYQAPKTWVQRAFSNLIYYNQVSQGGHFAAWEEPQLFAEEMRAAFSTLRTGK